MTPQELKTSILQLAIQGKLVPQIPEEGTGEELYKQIQKEKQRLIKEGKIKKEKPLPEISEDEKPFDIPDSWKWVRIGSLLNKLVDGTHRTPKYTESGVPFVSVKNMSNGKLSLDDTKFISEEEHRELWSRCNPQRGDIILSKVGTTGVPAKVDTDVEFSLFVSVALLKFNNDLLDIDFLINSILAPSFQKQCKEHTRGVGNKNWVIIDIANTIMPLPPLAEQKRIVAKIEKLLPLIDRYEKAWSELEEFNKCFPVDMQKSILQTAIQGKLVPQLPEEGTGEELYQQIQKEKQRLIKEGKIKKEKPLPEISEDEKPFDIPDSWKWVKIGEIFSVIRGSSPRPKGSPLYWSNVSTKHHWVTIKDITSFSENGFLFQTHEFLTDEGAKKSTFVPCGELIIAVSGSTTGKFCILGIDGYIYDGLAAIINPTNIIGCEYLKYFFMWIYERLNAQKIGSAFPNINTDMLKNTLIPIPPLAEQKRIVAKLEEILPLCEKLK